MSLVTKKKARDNHETDFRGQAKNLADNLLSSNWDFERISLQPNKLQFLTFCALARAVTGCEESISFPICTEIGLKDGTWLREISS